MRPVQLSLYFSTLSSFFPHENSEVQEDGPESLVHHSSVIIYAEKFALLH